MGNPLASIQIKAHGARDLLKSLYSDIEKLQKKIIEQEKIVQEYDEAEKVVTEAWNKHLKQKQ